MHVGGKEPTTTVRQAQFSATGQGQYFADANLLIRIKLAGSWFKGQRKKSSMKFQ